MFTLLRFFFHGYSKGMRVFIRFKAYLFGLIFVVDKNRTGLQYRTGTEQRDFDLHFFHNSNLPGPLTNGLKYFRFWFRICQFIQIVQSPRGMIPRRVNVPGV